MSTPETEIKRPIIYFYMDFLILKKNMTEVYKQYTEYYKDLTPAGREYVVFVERYATSI